MVSLSVLGIGVGMTIFETVSGLLGVAIRKRLIQILHYGLRVFYIFGLNYKLIVIIPELNRVEGLILVLINVIKG